MISSRPWLKWLLVAAPVVLVEAAATLYFHGKVEDVARNLLLAGIGMSPLFAALLLPINTPSRGRVFRYGKWVAMTLALVLLFGPEALKWSWLLISCVWLLGRNEWAPASIRRKLSVSAWPPGITIFDGGWSGDSVRAFDPPTQANGWLEWGTRIGYLRSVRDSSPKEHTYFNTKTLDPEHCNRAEQINVSHVYYVLLVQDELRL